MCRMTRCDGQLGNNSHLLAIVQARLSPCLATDVYAWRYTFLAVLAKKKTAATGKDLGKHR